MFTFVLNSKTGNKEIHFFFFVKAINPDRLIANVQSTNPFESLNGNLKNITYFILFFLLQSENKS